MFPVCVCPDPSAGCHLGPSQSHLSCLFSSRHICHRQPTGCCIFNSTETPPKCTAIAQAQGSAPGSRHILPLYCDLLASNLTYPKFKLIVFLLTTDKKDLGFTSLYLGDPGKATTPLSVFSLVQWGALVRSRRQTHFTPLRVSRTYLIIWYTVGT